MKKKEFADLLAEKGVFEFKNEAEEKVNTILDVMKEVILTEGELNFVGWGKFEIIDRAERKGRNPNTGETMVIPAKKMVRFKPGKSLEVK